MKIKTILADLNETNIYIIYDELNNNAIIIDPCNRGSVERFVEQNRLNIDYMILTHEHYDHILELDQLRDKYDSIVISSSKCSQAIQSSKTNLSNYFELLLYFKGKKNDAKIEPFTCKKLDCVFEGYLKLYWQGHKIELYETPGHSKGSISIVFDDAVLFSGDSLLIDRDAITRFPGGSTKDYKNITLPFYERLDKMMNVYPGHGRGFVLKERYDMDRGKAE